MNDKIERRMTAPDLANTRLETRDDDETKKRIVGYGAVFYDGTEATEYELWEGAKERILPGAFDRALREDDVRGLVNHDANRLLGRTSAKTMGLSVDERGLFYQIDPPDTTIGRDAVVSLQRGDMSGSSFSFRITDERWFKVEDDVRIREIRGVRLYDVGPVTFPAYETTSAGLRADGHVEEARQSLRRWETGQRTREAEGMDMDLRFARVRAEA